MQCGVYFSTSGYRYICYRGDVGLLVEISFERSIGRVHWHDVLDFFPHSKKCIQWKHCVFTGNEFSRSVSSTQQWALHERERQKKPTVIRSASSAKIARWPLLCADQSWAAMCFITCATLLDSITTCHSHAFPFVFGTIEKKKITKKVLYSS